MEPLERFRTEFLRMHEGPTTDPSARWEAEPPVVRFVGPGKEPHWYSVSLIEPCAEEERVREVVAREVARAEGLGRAMEWKVFDFPAAPGLAGALEEAGFRRTRVSRLIFAPVSHEVSASKGVTVERVRFRKDLEIVRDINEAVWKEPSDWILDSLWREISAPKALTDVFVSRVYGRPAACAWVRYMGRVAFFFGGSSLPEFRGRGTYKALVRERIEEAHRRGMRFVLSECTPDSERVLRGLGFQDGGVAEVYARG